VMFWIAGGGYFAGTGGISLYGPQYLLDKDIVLVTLNYRLGILGILFMSVTDIILYIKFSKILNNIFRFFKY